METHRTSVSTRRRFGYIMAFLLCMAWAGIAAPVYSQEQPVKAVEKLVEEMPDTEQEILKIYNIYEWKDFLEAQVLFENMLIDFGEYLMNIGEKEYPEALAALQPLGILVRGFLAINYVKDQLDASDLNSVNIFKAVYSAYKIGSWAMYKAILNHKKLAMKYPGFFAEYFMRIPEDEPDFFLELSSLHYRIYSD